jgi:hypothetical protein
MAAGTRLLGMFCMIFDRKMRGQKDTESWKGKENGGKEDRNGTSV